MSNAIRNIKIIFMNF